MKNLLLSIITIFLLIACNNKESAIQPVDSSSQPTEAWGAISNTNKPWTRWWWHGSSVTKAGITAELEALATAGIGGVELIPIYGIKGKEAAFIDYLSNEWVDLFLFTLQEAERLGLGVDMATGTGWPFGGPWVDAAIACKNVVHRTYQLVAGEQLLEKIELKQAPIFRTVRPIKSTLAEIKNPIATNPNLQALALDQVRFEQPLPLLVLMAYSDDGTVLNLTDKVNEAGQLNWIAPAGNWTLYAVFLGRHGKMVERAAPGGEGNVIDHFSETAIQQYLKEFDTAFAGKDITTLRAFFNDSYEVDDANGQADWTTNLFTAFQEKRGYDLRQHLPALFGEGAVEKQQRILSDYRETIGELLMETFTQTWGNWASKQQAIIRNQAHGSPANILDLYAASDIPETEGTDIIKAKMASSAAHVTGKKLVSAEAATWLGEHFTTNLADLKENVDRYFAAGINHVFYHGSCYSPPEADWPGRLFYAAIHANPRNPLWADYPALNNYIANTQAFLQAGHADNDILLYLPAYDRFARQGGELLEHFDGWATPKKGDTTEVRRTAEWLEKNGYAYDFISDKQLEKVAIKGKKISNGQHDYQTVLVPPTTYMPLSTLKKLAELTDQGATVIFQALPTSVPGWNNLEGRRQQFATVQKQLTTSGAIMQADLSTALAKAKIARESLVDKGLQFHRRSNGTETIYFITNWSEQSFDGWLPLATSFQTATIYCPMTRQKGVAKQRTRNGQSAIYLQLQKGQSLILKVGNQPSPIAPWAYLKTTNTTIQLTGKWQLSFDQGGPTLPATTILDEAINWTDLEASAYQHFSGTGTYQMEFDLPPGEGSGWLLDLGKANESATVVLNGQTIGTLVGPSYQILLPAKVFQAKNTLAIQVSNTMANRISYLEKNGKRWQQFYNINISARLRENLGEDRVFTTKHWKTRPAGLEGAVTLTLCE